MKQLTIEQKAQRFDEALERARKEHKNHKAFKGFCEILMHIFPELKESEDERIRKELIEQVVYIVPNNDEVDSEGNVLSTYQKRIDKYRAWLEKQGGQKPVDKVEPKFHAGEWIVENTDTSTWLITRVFITEENVMAYNMINQEGRTLIIGSHNIDYHHHLWTIKDAKAGDVLADKYNNIGFLKECEGIYWDSYIYLGCDGKLRGFSIGGKHEQTDAHPATKEQRDAIMKAMADAGYTFDFDKKELKEIENKNPLLSDFFKAEYKRGKADAQKPDGWSENKKLYTIDVYYPTCGSEVKEAIEQGIAYSKTEKKEILISLNGIFLRITPSSTTENVINEYNNYAGKNIVIKEKTNFINQWNNDDELYLKGVITDIECEVLCANCSREIADLKIHWLKSLKDRVQLKQEWSEEDEKLFNRICDLIHEAAYGACQTDEDGKELGEYAKMMRLLKSLKSQKEEQTEWDGTEIAPPIDSDVCG